MSKVAEKDTAANATRSEAILRASGLAKSFRMGDATVQVLKGVDLTIRRGEFIAIEGRSGSGKSTLLHIMGALEAPDAGTLSFHGENYTPPPPSAAREASLFVQYAAVMMIFAGLGSSIGAIVFVPVMTWLPRAIAVLCLWIVALAWWLTAQYFAERKATHLRNSKFGFVFQFYHLLPELNVLENTLLGVMVERSWLGFWSTRKEHVARATKILEQLGMSHRLKHRPNQLSGGERQRAAIARALMNDPQVLFADEPTGNLDADTGRQIMDLLEKLHRDKGQTIVMVTHDRTLAREADRVLVLKDGKLAAAEA